jgi:hypothetical protein
MGQQWVRPELIHINPESIFIHNRKCNVYKRLYLMPKISKGRIDGLEGMNSYSSDELFVMAEDYYNKLSDPTNSDDPKWLKRRADRLRSLAIEQEKTKVPKANQ